MPFLSHWWTVVPRLRHALRPLPFPPLRPWTSRLQDPEVGPIQISGHLVAAGSEQGPDGAVSGEDLLVVVHGMGGSTGSHYMRRAAWAAQGAGVTALLLNLRGSDRRGDDFYHAALTADLHAALASPELARFRRIYVLGFSLGGHVALRYACEPGDERLQAVAAVCSPLDLSRAVVVIDAPAARLYLRYLLRALLDIYGAVAARRPVPLPLAAAIRIRRMREWDERVVSPRHGFAGADDYYARASAGPRLPHLRVPALLLNSEHDPFVPAHTVRPAAEAPRLTARFLLRGGHVAFPKGLETGLGEGPGVEDQILAWLRTQG
jgi:predicted alpha/beta-fold hydrolase